MAKAVLTKNSPFYVQFYVSKHCNLRCRMCNIVEANADLAPFPGDRIEDIARNLRRIGVGVVLLTGGEPFLRKDIDRIVQTFKAYNLDIRLQTAGLYSQREKIKRCAELGVTDINVSLDSLDRSFSDSINGVEGSFDNAIRTIAYISRTFPAKGAICALGCVLSRYNLDHVRSVLEFATEIGWWLSLVPVHITDADTPLNFRGQDALFSLPPDQHQYLEELIKDLKRLKRKGALLFDSDDYLDSILHFVRTGSPNWRHQGICDSPNLYFAILPDGRFAPCCDHRLERVVHVYDPDFPALYASGILHQEVRAISRNCPGCNFGSFPEMTLSARSPSTILERLRTQCKALRRSQRPFEENELFALLERIKARHPVYAAPLEHARPEKLTPQPDSFRSGNGGEE